MPGMYMRIKAGRETLNIQYIDGAGCGLWRLQSCYRAETLSKWRKAPVSNEEPRSRLASGLPGRSRKMGYFVSFAAHIARDTARIEPLGFTGHYDFKHPFQALHHQRSVGSFGYNVA